MTHDRQTSRPRERTLPPSLFASSRLPAADLALLMLGPGTTITHRAICNLADCNCTVVWCGDEGSRFDCHGRGATHFSANLLHQIAVACDPVSRAELLGK